MDSKRIVSSLCYISILFAGILFPIAAYFASEDLEVKQHAKKALLSHLIPLIPFPFMFVSLHYETMLGQGNFPVFVIINAVFMVILSLIVLVWNLVKGIKLLNNKEVL